MPQGCSSSGPPALETGAVIVVVSPREAESLSLRQIFGRAQSSVRWFPTCRKALSLLEQCSAGVVIAGTELPDGNWRSLLDELSRFAPPPRLIVYSRLADERLWCEVLNRGGYDVLLMPFDPQEVIRVTTSAWFAWKQELARVLPPRKPAAAAPFSAPQGDQERSTAAGV